MFRSLRTKLAVLYAGLCGIILLFLALAVQIAATDTATRAVRAELEANGLVFDRLWEMRAAQMSENAELLARDFGFRAAVSTHDKATIGSALANLKDRFGVDRAFVVTLDGSVISAGDSRGAAPPAALARALEDADANSGVLMEHNEVFQAVAAPIRAPDTIGWVVFASKLDPTYLLSLQRLAAIPLKADVFVREDAGDWTSPTLSADEKDTSALTRFLAASADHGQARELNTKAGRAVAYVRPLNAMLGGASGQALLLLRYPLTLALKPYQALLWAMGVVSLLGLGMLIWGSFALARTLTRPIEALENAVGQLKRGQTAKVEAQSTDEIGRLAESFNDMAAEIQSRETHIRHLASHDLETELPNRRAVEDAIRALATANPGRTIVAAAIRIERFRDIRGAIGYGLASALVRQLALRLNEDGVSHCVARISTDMLAACAVFANGRAAASAYFDNIATRLEAPVRLSEVDIDINVTIGAAFYEGGAESTAINKASIAIDQARRMHAKSAFFDAAAYGDPASGLSLISDLFEGMSDGSVSLYYQPKHDLRLGRITGAEALIRWRHRLRGMISPDLFIPLAEKTSHIRAITEWTLDRALADQALMRAAGHDLLVSVNLSGRLVGDGSFADLVLDKIRQAQGRICLEITETAVVSDADAAVRMIDRFRREGVEVSIDDYGAGLSSLSYLKQIKAHELKLDKSLVLSAADGPRDVLLIKSTIDLAHGLGMKVTAEGVETAAILAVLASMGCDVAQGYHIGRPAPLPQFITALAPSAAEAPTAALRA